MHDPTNSLLVRLAAMPAPDALDTLENDVFAAIDEQARGHRFGRRAGTLSVVAALALGLFGGGLIDRDAADRVAGPIGMDVRLAPSTLLLGR